MLWFLIRNKGHLNTFVVHCRYSVYFAGHKVRDKLSFQSFFKSSLHLFQKKTTKSILYFFYWEIVLCIRKITIVGVGVFGPSLGTVRQSQVALLIIVLFFVLELLGSPFKEKPERHKILAKLELSSLLVLFLTMWSGLMIFSSAELTIRTCFSLLRVIVMNKLGCTFQMNSAINISNNSKQVLENIQLASYKVPLLSQNSASTSTVCSR